MVAPLAVPGIHAMASALSDRLGWGYWASSSAPVLGVAAESGVERECCSLEKTCGKSTNPATPVEPIQSCKTGKEVTSGLRVAEQAGFGE